MWPQGIYLIFLEYNVLSKEIRAMPLSLKLLLGWSLTQDNISVDFSTGVRMVEKGVNRREYPFQEPSFFLSLHAKSYSLFLQPLAVKPNSHWKVHSRNTHNTLSLISYIPSFSFHFPSIHFHLELLYACPPPFSALPLL